MMMSPFVTGKETMICLTHKRRLTMQRGDVKITRVTHIGGNEAFLPLKLQVVFVMTSDRKSHKYSGVFI